MSDWHRLKAIMQLNAATLQHYWWLGNIQKQKEQGWGAKVIDQLSVDLQKRYGGDSGYSSRNLGYMKNFAREYPDFPFLQVTCKITGNLRYRLTENLCKCRLHKLHGITIFQ